MANIKFNIGQGGLGRPENGRDYYSGFLFDSATYPSGFSAEEPIKFLGSVEDAEDLGIVNDGTGETVATGGSVEITATGAAGDTWTVDIKSLRSSELRLAEVIESSGESVDSLASRIADNVNQTTLDHGFTATAALGVVSLVMADNWGAAFNTAGLSSESTGLGTSTETQFAGGVGSDISVMHYHISEFFRIIPKGFLWFGIYDESGGLDTTHVEDITNEANGEIRQMDVYLKTAWSSSDMAALQNVVEKLQGEYKNLNIVYAADQLGGTLTALDNLRALNYDRVSACLGQDGGGEGWRLVDCNERSISCIGASLGTIAEAQVHENIGWVAQFDISGAELNVLSFTTGDLYKSTSSNTVDLLAQLGWLFIRKYVSKGGSYHYDSPTAVSETSDYAYIENGRTIDKAIRGVNTVLTDFLNSPVFVDPNTGQLTELSVSNFKNAASIPLEDMLVDLELSGYEVIINPDQNVLATSSVEITIKLVPVGVAREIVVNIGYTVKIQS